MTKIRKPAADASPPKWIAIVGAFVAVGGLAFTWFSHFFPNPKPPKAPDAAASAPAAPSIAASVIASGSGAVAIGVVQGGTINVGSPGARPEPSPSAPNPAPGSSKK